MTTPRHQPSSRRGETERLVALLDGQRVGSVHQNANGRLRFTYDDMWRDKSSAYAISLSMPLTAETHEHEAINAFLWGLLPDNSRTLDRYGRLFGVSSANPIGLLAHIGADCAGAIQFARPDEADKLLGVNSRSPEVDWLTSAEVAAELRTVREQGVPGTTYATVGQFSLAGAQPKIALLEENGRWGRPKGRTPTNRILKPPSSHDRGFAENEHFCLGLFACLELGSVKSRVIRFEDETAIVVDRFDRAKAARTYYRIHQEDVCQALGVMPTRKYENEGGPGIRSIISLLREASQQPQDDIDRLLGALAVTWVIAATDGHAKNYAVLHGPGGAIRLAPFYDVASFLPYAERALHRVKLAMKIGSQYLVRRIGRSSWEALAKSNGLPVRRVLDTVEQTLVALPAAVEQVGNSVSTEGLDKRFVDLLSKRCLERVTECLAALTRTSGLVK